MITNKDRVSMMFGKHVADTLEEEELIRLDFKPHTVRATHWQVMAWTGRGKADWYDLPPQLRNELKSGLLSTGEAMWLTDNQKTAQRYATMVTNAGMNASVTAMIMLPASSCL